MIQFTRRYSINISDFTHEQYICIIYPCIYRCTFHTYNHNVKTLDCVHGSRCKVSSDLMPKNRLTAVAHKLHRKFVITNGCTHFPIASIRSFEYLNAVFKIDVISQQSNIISKSFPVLVLLANWKI